MDIRSFLGKSKTAKTMDPETAWRSVVAQNHPTWKVVVDGDKDTLYMWKQGKWVEEGVSYGGNQEGWGFHQSWCVKGLDGELRVVVDEGELRVSAVLTDENDDGPCIYFENDVCVFKIKS